MRVEEIETLIKPAIEALGCQLWGLQLAQNKITLLRIYIDKAVVDGDDGDKKQGIGIEDCERVSRQVSRVFEVEEPFSGEYTLEVSSPGLDRELFTLEQFAQFSGSQVNIRLRVPFQKRRKFKGLLCGVEGDEVVLRMDEEELLLPIDSIEKARVVLDK